MLSGYECSILGFDQNILKDFNLINIDIQNIENGTDPFTNFTSEYLIQDAWSLIRSSQPALVSEIAEKVIARDPNSLFAAEAYILLGNIAAEKTTYQLAEKNFFQAASICRLLGNEKGIGISLQNLAALVYLPQGQVDLALSIMEESNYHLLRANAPAWGYPLLQSYVFDILGDRHQLVKALDDLIMHLLPGSYAAGVYFLIWAKICLDDGDTQKAEEYLRLAFRIANQLGIPDLSVFVRNEKSRYSRSKNQISVALNWAKDAVNLSKQTKSTYLLGFSLNELGQVSLLNQDEKAAEKYFSSAINQFNKSNSPLDAARSEFLLAALLNEQNDRRAYQLFIHATDQVIKSGYTAILFRDRKIIFPLITYFLKKTRGESKQKASALLDLFILTPAIPLRVFGLGQFRVFQGQHLIPDQSWSKRKAGALFMFLLLQRDRMATREVIMESIWPELDPSAAADTLYQATSTIRRILEPELPEKFPSRYLLIEGEQVYLRLSEGSYTDFDHFQRDLPAAIKNNKIEELQKLLSLYEGELFPKYRYAGWVQDKRNDLEMLYLQGMSHLGMLYLINQEYYQELDASRKILRIDPWNEDAVLMAMQAYIGMNNIPRAIIYYEEFRNSLENELGIKPRSDLRELADEISNR
jgi:DNA-binding SARP family transcriptional activator